MNSATHRPGSPSGESTNSMRHAAVTCNEENSAFTGSGNSPEVPPLSTSSWRQKPLSADESDKVRRILEACRDGDVDSLRQLAASEGGLIEDEVRRTAWPILLGCDPNQDGVEPGEWVSVEAHRDEGQVELDVNRSFIFYPREESDERKEARKRELSRVITEVLRQNPMLNYFQGYHDIVQVLLLVLGANAAVPAVSRLSLLRIRDFMLPSMSGTEAHLRILPSILHDVDPVLYTHLSQTQPFFALAATLTLYAHEIEDYGEIARLFDFLLANEAAISLYLFAEIVIARKSELMEIDADEPEMLGAVLSKLPKPLHLESLIQRTLDTFRKHPPDQLSGRVWERVSSHSVLKTTRDFQQLVNQTLEDGRLMFAKYDAEIKRKDAWMRQKQRARQMVKRYNRPATYTSLAVVFAVVAYLLRTTCDARPASFLALSVGIQQKALSIFRHYFA